MRRHKEVQRYCPSAGISLWDAAFATASVTKSHAGSWNVCSLVKESGDCWVCHTRGVPVCGTTVERKVDLLLKNSNISIATSRRPNGLALTSGPLVNGPFCIRVRSYQLMVTSVLELEFCWMVGLLLLLERCGRLCHLMPD